MGTTTSRSSSQLGPFSPAWDDLVTLTSRGTVYHVRIAALRTHMQITGRDREEGAPDGNATISFPLDSPVESRPPRDGDDFRLRSQCLVHLAPPDDDGGETANRTDSILLFLYKHNSSLATSNLPLWKDPAVQSNRIRQLGPGCFRSFPAHHFFVRVYRHNAICAALLNREPTFLSGPGWTTVPWESHPKAPLDRLLDILALVPSLLARSDRILPHDPSLARCLMAQDLLASCLGVERQLDDWHASVLAPSPSTPAGSHAQPRPPMVWVDGPGASSARIPFAGPLAFRGGPAALALVHLWAARVLLHPCVESLRPAVFQPVVDAFPQVYPGPPAPLLEGPLASPRRYGAEEVRELAASVCRGLDYALGAAAQPDLLAFPVGAAEAFYGAVSAVTGDGALELLWLEAFRGRLAAKGREVAEVVQGRRWVEVMEF